MPELPEVEVTRRGIEPYVRGRRVERVDVRTGALRWPVPPELPQTLALQKVHEVGRRGKYLLFETDAGWFIVHLGMTGTLRVLPQESAPAPAKHDHIDWIFDDFLLRFRDPRRFGAVLWHPRAAGEPEAHPLLAKLGVEPFSPPFTGELIHRRTRGRTASIKQALLAGDIVVGVGNIYASESLFRAGIRPTTAAGRLSPARCERLADAVRATLAAAIERGGSTLRDFVGSNGESGYFQLDCFVYDRAGLPCRVCGTPVRQLVQGQRSTYFCPHCQR
ncbi:bifunctional DNA-formamidopyrimidine glycosylase/DNA-(apurinic or apyrimidinic site) lyase [Trinickia caryophylli]|uniref:Formamidopyrimidine-DNA glycosylase n=1 Tax=Trinickia caryophylli TaxID=28094 RepID=A0A1X7ES30_TRICW|nr:bifunctional DNA-formamidopyrimidine glycosylase/DNA-(apurinic or apyrimidinic site) lyase [Trinickia caryophylli]PMS12036.1 bifunctional DNA-formamidopyrimidine glycosylase/DNA-(apurinic or apyrimidinic site) lyase [Trinickia caryophylli]TRX18657.1 bifunctional DNA-formamidopyrimidine glycosylase/DNA-(apurinic or apyrimidinic site) lyase [Trinickia caryophylli]WQE10548.1 bifunctional DNA-formamidopyrimidine glycosylase/DNA-(apurinic or apyrimidinic site) lyase [Trinickia caryophylli]SMF3845